MLKVSSKNRHKSMRQKLPLCYWYFHLFVSSRWFYIEFQTSWFLHITARGLRILLISPSDKHNRSTHVMSVVVPLGSYIIALSYCISVSEHALFNSYIDTLFLSCSLFTAIFCFEELSSYHGRTRYKLRTAQRQLVHTATRLPLHTFIVLHFCKR